MVILGKDLADSAGSGAAWTWSGAAARLAESVDPSDIGAVGFQSDIAAYFRYLGGPVTWGQLPHEDVAEWRTVTAIQNNNGQPHVFGTGTLTVAGGTLTQRGPSAGTKGSAAPRVGYVTSAVPGQNAIMRQSGGMIPSSAGVRAEISWVTQAMSAGMRWFAGFGSPPTLGNAINTILDCVGVGREAEANLQQYNNDGSGTCTQVDLGASFPAIPGAIQLMHLQLYAPSASQVGWNLRNADTGLEASGTIITNVGNLGGMMLYFCNVADAVAVSVDFCTGRYAALR